VRFAEYDFNGYFRSNGFCAPDGQSKKCCETARWPLHGIIMVRSNSPDGRIPARHRPPEFSASIFISFVHSTIFKPIFRFVCKRAKHYTTRNYIFILNIRHALFTCRSNFVFCSGAPFFLMIVKSNSVTSVHYPTRSIIV